MSHTRGKPTSLGDMDHDNHTAMCLALRLGFGMGVVSIDAFQVCLELLPNFHSENSAEFRLIFVAEI